MEWFSSICVCKEGVYSEFLIIKKNGGAVYKGAIGDRGWKVPLSPRIH